MKNKIILICIFVFSALVSFLIGELIEVGTQAHGCMGPS